MKWSALDIKPSMSLQEKIQTEFQKMNANEIFEVHQNPPPFWNKKWDEELESELITQSKYNFSTCPICHHRLEAPIFSENFNDPWWLYPQKAFSHSHTCNHFQFLTFSILWTRSEPMASPWIIPCGWGVPAFTEEMKNDENLAITIKQTQLQNGATIFWIGFYQYQNEHTLQKYDYWSLPLLKSKSAIKPDKHSKGFWGEFSPLTINTPILWSKLYIENSKGNLENYETKKDTTHWAQRIKTWGHLAYSQPLKMYLNRFASESGLASFAIGMRSSKTRGALFISQTPIYKSQYDNSNILNLNSLNDSSIAAAPFLQILNSQQMKDLAQTDTLWAIVDPFQNEAIQDWLRLLKKMDSTSITPVWKETELEDGWKLTADSSYQQSLNQAELINYYRDLSPLIIKLSSEAIEASYNYNLGNQSWGGFFISSASVEEIHSFLRQLLVSYVQDQLVYFRFYETNFLSVALATLNNSSLNFFYGPISAWILRHPSETHYTLYSNSNKGTNQSFHKQNDLQLNLKPIPNVLPKHIHEAALRSFQMDLPRRILDFIKTNVADFFELIPEKILLRWIHITINQAAEYEIKKEPSLVKFFLWKSFITPTWCLLGPFTKILRQNVAEEMKIHNIENLLPKLSVSEIPRSLTLEAWDPDLWNELRQINSPLGNTDPSAFYQVLGEKPPLVILHNPQWIRAVGQFYENAYSELFDLTGNSLLRQSLNYQLKKPLHPPPHLSMISKNELVVIEDGDRSHTWLQNNSFSLKAGTKNEWIYRSAFDDSILFVARLFLQEFPYIGNKELFNLLSEVDRKKIYDQIKIYVIEWDKHQLWKTTPIDSQSQ